MASCRYNDDKSLSEALSDDDTVVVVMVLLRIQEQLVTE